MSVIMIEKDHTCFACKSENTDILVPKGRKRKRNYLTYCHDCKAMTYAISLGKTTYKFRNYAEVHSYLKMGDTIY